MPELLDFSTPHVLRDESEYERAIQEIDDLLDADPPQGTSRHERLEFLSVLVEEYEDRHFPMGDDVTPREAVDFMLDQKGLERSDMAEWMGGRSRVSEFFSGKRRLSKGQIEALREELGLSADVLMG